jgi:heme/copper-type cytochrome/quinol oxidase subunit 1
MVRDYIITIACVLMLLGFAAGIATQLELLRPGVLFLDAHIWSQIVTLHVWATIISIVVICLITIPLIRHKKTLWQWIVWLGFSIFPLLYGFLVTLIFNNAPSDTLLEDTVFLTANRHAYGTAALLAALGGLSALQRVRLKNLSLKVSFAFALFITGSGVLLAIYQSQLGLFGMPRGYNDYPREFAQVQFYSSLAGIACLSLSTIYVILLWRCSDKKTEKIEEVF